MKKTLFIYLFTLTLVNAIHSSEIRRYRFGEWSEKIGYSEAVAVDNTLYLSGIIGSGNTMEESLNTAIKQINVMLERFKLDSSYILKEKIYTNDIKALRNATHIRKEYYQPDFPAAVWIQVNEDKMPGHWVEIELIVYIPDDHQFPEVE